MYTYTPKILKHSYVFIINSKYIPMAYFTQLWTYKVYNTYSKYILIQPQMQCLFASQSYVLFRIGRRHRKVFKILDY